jgi:hypothetical protein
MILNFCRGASGRAVRYDSPGGNVLLDSEKGCSLTRVFGSFSGTKARFGTTALHESSARARLNLARLCRVRFVVFVCA